MKTSLSQSIPSPPPRRPQVQAPAEGGLDRSAAKPLEKGFNSAQILIGAGLAGATLLGGHHVLTGSEVEVESVDRFQLSADQIDLAHSSQSVSNERGLQERISGALTRFDRVGAEGSEQAGLYGRGGLFAGFRQVRLSPQEALERLREGKTVKVPGTEADKPYELESLNDLLLLDDLVGSGGESVLQRHQIDALRNLGEHGSFHTQLGSRRQSKDLFQTARNLASDTSVFVELQGARPVLLRNLEDLVDFNALEAGGEHPVLQARELSAIRGLSGRLIDPDTRGRMGTFEAYQSLSRGEAVRVTSGAVRDTLSSVQDLAEFYELEVTKESELPELERLLYFRQAAGEEAFREGDGIASTYRALQRLQAGQDIGVRAGGDWNAVTSFEDLRELDVLVGRGGESLLPEEQQRSLESLTRGLAEGEGLLENGRSVNLYQAFQALQNEGSLQYRFEGGDQNQETILPLTSFEQAPVLQQLVSNQHEYDRYGYSSEEFNEKHRQVLDELGRTLPADLTARQGLVLETASGLQSAELEISRSAELAGQAADNANLLHQGLQELTTGPARESLLSAARAVDSAEREHADMAGETREVESELSGLEKHLNDLEREILWWHSPTDEGEQEALDGLQFKWRTWGSPTRGFDELEDEVEALRMLVDHAGGSLNRIDRSVNGAADAVGGVDQSRESLTRESAALSEGLPSLQESLSGWASRSEEVGQSVTPSVDSFLSLSPHDEMGTLAGDLGASGAALGSLDASAREAVGEAAEANSTSSQLARSLEQHLQAVTDSQVMINRASQEVGGLGRTTGQIQSRVRAVESEFEDLERAFSRMTWEMDRAGIDHWKVSRVSRSLRELEDEIDDLATDARFFSMASSGLGAPINRVSESLDGMLEKASPATQQAAQLKQQTAELESLTGSAASHQTRATEALSGSAAFVQQYEPAWDTVFGLGSGLVLPSQGPALEETRSRLEGISDSGQLTSSVPVAGRGVDILSNQLERPARPEGWVPPQPRLEE